MNRWDNYGELYHHGILGQKWGIRRYQNEDGSLTEEGRKRYSSYNPEGLDYNGYRNYEKDTLKKARKAAQKEVSKTKEYRQYAVAAGALNTLSTGVGIASSLLVPEGAPLFAGMTLSTIGSVNDGILSKGKEEAAKALGYSGFADLTLSKYDEFAAKANMPNMKQMSYMVRNFVGGDAIVTLDKKLRDDLQKSGKSPYDQVSYNRAYMDWVGQDKNISKLDSYKQWRKEHK